ncbi:MAG: hypothetical protein HY722_09475, partial [Planctomycetes bacterium]|nr:hypothetical protein [Planctomycetota bacterium]
PEPEPEPVPEPAALVIPESVAEVLPESELLIAASAISDGSLIEPATDQAEGFPGETVEPPEEPAVELPAAEDEVAEDGGEDPEAPAPRVAGEEETDELVTEDVPEPASPPNVGDPIETPPVATPPSPTAHGGGLASRLFGLFRRGGRESEGGTPGGPGAARPEGGAELRRLIDEDRRALDSRIPPLGESLPSPSTEGMDEETAEEEVPGVAAPAPRDMVEIAIQVNGQDRMRLTVEKDLPRNELAKRAVQDPRVRRLLLGKSVARIVEVPNKAVNVVLK